MLVVAWLVTVAFGVVVGLIIAAAAHNPHAPFDDSVQPRRAPTRRR